MHPAIVQNVHFLAVDSYTLRKLVKVTFTWVDPTHCEETNPFKRWAEVKKLQLIRFLIGGFLSYFLCE